MNSGGDDGNTNAKNNSPNEHGSKPGVALEGHEPSLSSTAAKGVKEDANYHIIPLNNKDFCHFYHQGSENCPTQPGTCSNTQKAVATLASSLPKRHSKSRGRRIREQEKGGQGGADAWLEQGRNSKSSFPLISLVVLVSALTSVYYQKTRLVDEHLLPVLKPSFPLCFPLPSIRLCPQKQQLQPYFHPSSLAANYQSARERKATTVEHQLQSMTSSAVPGRVPYSKNTPTTAASTQQQYGNHGGQEREFFDPMVGTFRANPSTPYNSFFNSKMRWRGELELAEYAWNQERQVNMVRTEQRGRAAPCNTAAASSAGPTASGSQQLDGQQQQGGPHNNDPSLMDYEAIDVYWRRDIEQEKGGIASVYYNTNRGHQLHQQMSIDSAASEQYEQDLQLLTEKSLFVPLNPEERYRYENLSKAHYSDFYHALGQPLQTRAKQKELTHLEQGIATTSSGKSIGGGSVILTDISYSRPASSSDQRAPTPAYYSNGSIKNEVFSDYDEDKPEDFFRHLAKESLENEPLPTLGVTTAASSVATADLIDPMQAFFTNVSLCSPHPMLLNNVSLSDAVPVSASSMIDVFATNMTAEGTNATMSNLPQTSSTLELDGASNDPRNSTYFSANSTLMDNDSFSCNITDYGFQEEINQNFSAAFNNQTTAFTFAANYTSPETAVQNSIAPIPAAQFFNFSSCDSSDGIFMVDSESRCDGEASPSSGIGTMCSSSSSPRSLEDSALPTSRFHNKLVPLIDNEEPLPSAHTNERVLSQIQEVNTGVQPRRRGRQSRDDQLVNDNGLPATADQITVMSHQEIQKMMRDPKLSATQKALIKKIRRRGRNKVAARKCRERRLPSESHLGTSAAAGSVIYSDNTLYDDSQMHQTGVYMSELDYRYAQPSTSKQTTSTFYHHNSRF